MRPPWFGVGEAIPYLPTGDKYDGEGTLNSSKRRAVLAEKNSKRPHRASWSLPGWDTSAGQRGRVLCEGGAQCTSPKTQG